MSTTGALGTCCPACGFLVAIPVLEFPRPVPVLCNAFGPTSEHAVMAPADRMELVVCGRCTLLWNTAFDSTLADYETNYDNSLHFSGVFASYAESLVQRLNDRNQLAGRHIVEIGCGDGAFLDRLCEVSNAVGVGIDPSFAQKPRAEFRSPQVSVHSRLFELGDSDGAALLIARHVLEHVPNPAAFLRLLRGNGQPAEPAVIYVEVPSADYMIRTHAFWDLIYEHPTYFTHGALVRLLAQTGWQPVEGGDSFHGQYLWMDASATAQVPSRRKQMADIEATISAARSFGAAFEGHLRAVDTFIRSRAAQGRIVLWGTGSKAVTLLNLLPSRDLITCAVDINPAKQGTFVPGSGHAVIAPTALAEVTPTTILLMNSAYKNEVQTTVANLGIAASIESLPGSAS